MAGRGVHFAITDEQAAALRAADDPKAALARVAEIEEAWDAIHRALTDGQLVFGGDEPLAKIVLGGEVLVDDGDEVLVLIAPDDVRAAAKAVAVIDEPVFRERYFRLCPGYAPEFGEDDA